MKKLITLLATTIFMVGCVEQKDFEFFSKEGVIIGTPLFQKDGEYNLPIKFKTKIMHSAQWLYDVKHELKENEIHITALYSVPPNGKESVYKGHIKLAGVRNGTYSLYYINKNQSMTHIGSVKFK